MSTPFDLKNLVENIRQQNPSTEILQLCTELLKRLPQSRTRPDQRGKVCPDCSYKMHNRCLISPGLMDYRVNVCADFQRPHNPGP